MLADLIGRWRTRRAERARARRFYDGLVAQARQPGWYTQLGVPDNFDGRFDMVALHAHLGMARLQRENERGRLLAQYVHDHMMEDWDASLRQMGVGDVGVFKRVKKLTRAYYGRAGAYTEALGAGEAAVADALRRNVYRGSPPDEASVTAMAQYVLAFTQALAERDMATLLAGDVPVVAVPVAARRRDAPAAAAEAG